jgi:hypothetical protein
MSFAVLEAATGEIVVVLPDNIEGDDWRRSAGQRAGRSIRRSGSFIPE